MEVTTVILHDRSSMQRDPALFTELARHAMLNCLLLKSIWYGSKNFVCLYMRPFSEFVQIHKMKTYAVNG